MGTERFREDASQELKKFLKANPDQKPTKLKVNYRDAMDWLQGSKSRQAIQSFINQNVKSYVNTIPMQESTLKCSVELLNIDDDAPTRFE
jgi:hypothetical protein